MQSTISPRKLTLKENTVENGTEIMWKKIKQKLKKKGE